MNRCPLTPPSVIIFFFLFPRKEIVTSSPPLLMCGDYTKLLSSKRVWFPYYDKAQHRLTKRHVFISMTCDYVKEMVHFIAVKHCDVSVACGASNRMVSFFGVVTVESAWLLPKSFLGTVFLQGNFHDFTHVHITVESEHGSVLSFVRVMPKGASESYNRWKTILTK